MGLAIGYFAGPNSAPAAINLIYLPMSFCSGLWVPYMFLPKLVRQIALALPPYHLSQLALGMVGAGAPRVHRNALGSSARLHSDLPGRSPHRLSARPGQSSTAKPGQRFAHADSVIAFSGVAYECRFKKIDGRHGDTHHARPDSFFGGALARAVDSRRPSGLASDASSMPTHWPELTAGLTIELCH